MLKGSEGWPINVQQPKSDEGNLMTSIPSNSNQAILLSRQVVESSQKSAENRHDFEQSTAKMETLKAEAMATEEAIIERSKEQDLTISYAEFQGRHATVAERMESSFRVMEIFGKELPSKTEAANRQLESLEKAIQHEHPSLSNKAWDFSLDENNQFTLVEVDALSDEEKHYLTNKLNESGLHEAFAQLRDVMIEGLVQERGVAKYSQNIGRYDLTQDNFSDIIRFRDFKENTTGGDTISSPGFALANQLAARAEDVYSNYIRVYV